MKKIGFFWGRINPPHKGHMKLIKSILKEVDILIFVIGSSQYKNTERNPFSGSERKRMLKAYLIEEGINPKRVRIFPVPDIETSFERSVKNVISKIPKFNVAYSTYEIKEQKDCVKKEIDTILRRELKQSGVKLVRFKRGSTLSSTRIRNAIAHDEKWEHLTGKSVVKIIKKLDGINRIKKAYRI